MSEDSEDEQETMESRRTTREIVCVSSTVSFTRKLLEIHDGYFACGKHDAKKEIILSDDIPGYL